MTSLFVALFALAPVASSEGADATVRQPPNTVQASRILQAVFPETGGLTSLNSENGQLFVAVAANDLYAFAYGQVPEYATRFDATQDSQYQREQLRKDIHADKALRSAFNEVRSALIGREFAAPAPSGWSVLYEHGRFFVERNSCGIEDSLYGKAAGRFDDMRFGVVAGTLLYGVSVGGWGREKCRDGSRPFELKRLPSDLKPRLQQMQGIALRIRWKGLPKVVRLSDGGFVSGTWASVEDPTLEVIEGASALWSSR